MLKPETFFQSLQAGGVQFFTGVPDSLLKDICAYISDHTPPERHIISANEGTAVALAMGYHLATGGLPLVYLQNSGLGNLVNPVLSLADPEIYSIPMLLMIGWRGEPGVKDEPQHKKQGRVTEALLRTLEIPCETIDAETREAGAIVTRLAEAALKEQRPQALLVRKGTFEPYQLSATVPPRFEMNREEAIQCVIDQLSAEDLVVSTTGMTSRELFEYREARGEGHERDFLTVGGMGHASQIALGLALQQPARQVFCLDGDGAALMHLGGWTTIGASGCGNFKQILINNGAHDSVGGQPTLGFAVDFQAMARAAGYREVSQARSKSETVARVQALRRATGPALLEIRVNAGHRPDLGRPTIPPLENKKHLMAFLRRPPASG